MKHLAQTPLSDRLRVLVDTVQHNERTLRRFQEVELRLILAQDFASFLRILLDELPREFSLAHVTLWLDDGATLARDLLQLAGSYNRSLDHLRCAPAGGVTARRLCVEGQPWLGRPSAFDTAGRIALFGEETRAASAIVLPLMASGQTSGYLCLGSDDPHRFMPGMATDILGRFASVVAASLDNVAHRERLRQLGMTDGLTGLSNRRYFDERLREEVLRAVRGGTPVACLFIDVDRFKQINDTYGHRTGDKALAAVAACVRQQTRLGDTIARYGGEEFAVLLQSDTIDALTVAERVRVAVEGLDLRNDDGIPIALSVSIGVAARIVTVRPDDAGDFAHELIEDADQAMYRAKRNGRNRIETAPRMTAA